MDKYDWREVVNAIETASFEFKYVRDYEIKELRQALKLLDKVHEEGMKHIRGGVMWQNNIIFLIA